MMLLFPKTLERGHRATNAAPAPSNPFNPSNPCSPERGSPATSREYERLTEARRLTLTRRRHPARRLGRRDDGMHLEVHQVGPGGDPFIEECAVAAFHYLIAPGQIVRHPAAHVADALGCKTSPATEAIVHRTGVAIAKVLDDHVEHCCVPCVSTVARIA